MLTLDPGTSTDWLQYARRSHCVKYSWISVAVAVFVVIFEGEREQGPHPLLQDRRYIMVGEYGHVDDVDLSMSVTRFMSRLNVSRLLC